jgi:hypothetical protein
VKVVDRVVTRCANVSFPAVSKTNAFSRTLSLVTTACSENRYVADPTHDGTCQLDAAVRVCGTGDGGSVGSVSGGA